jgi:uncharacterized protein YajQ (UPF0234 family)
MPSFDVVSKVDLQEVDNAVNQAIREISQRYDFKNSNTLMELKQKDLKVIIFADDDYKINAAKDILFTKFVKRNISLKNLKIGDVQPVAGRQLKIEITIEQGISKDHAKKVIDAVKKSSLKVQAQVMDDMVRVSGKKLDDLQSTIAHLRGANIELGLQFVNMKD